MSQTVSPSTLAVAAEVRAEMARQGLTTRAFARKMRTYDTWVHRRVSVKADVAMTLDELQRMVDALDRPMEQFLGPYLVAQAAVDRYGDEVRQAAERMNRYAIRDSNPEPAGYEQAAGDALQLELELDVDDVDQAA